MRWAEPGSLGTLLAWAIVLGECGLLDRGMAADASKSQVYELVKKNESLTSLIKLDYRVRYGPRPASLSADLSKSGPRRTSGRPFTGYRGTWAQDGIRQYHQYDYLSGPNEVVRQELDVVTGEVAMTAKRPDLMVGSILPIERHQWRPGPVHWAGIRPFETELLLSDFIGLPETTVGQVTQHIEGREAFVATGRFHSRRYYRTYIDCERGVLLRLDPYPYDPRERPAAEGGSSLVTRQVLQLPNGGWLPVRTEKNPDSDGASSFFEIDPNTITIAREDIPDSLFTIDFPEGAKIANAITGTVTQGKRTWDPSLEMEAKLITEQVINAAVDNLGTSSGSGESTGAGAFPGPSAPTAPGKAPGSRQIEPNDPVPPVGSTGAGHDGGQRDRLRLAVVVAIGLILGVFGTLFVWSRRAHGHEKAGRP